MDAIAFLKKDHTEVKRLFRRLLDDGELEETAGADLYRRLRRELSIHADIEEQVLYPTLRERMPDGEEEVLQALEEHHIAKTALAELDGMPLDHERFEAKLTVLQEYVLHHVKEEETKLFPRLREALSRHELVALGERLAEAKRVAPTRPHPSAPDTPPVNRVTSLAASVMDRSRDLAGLFLRTAWGMIPSRSRAV